MITHTEVHTWVKQYRPGPTGEFGREKHKEYTENRHRHFQDQIKKYIRDNQPCTFNQIWIHVGIKRTTCNTIIRNMVKIEVIMKKKGYFKNRKQYIYYINLTS